MQDGSSFRIFNATVIVLFYSFIRLCDYLVVTMLHNLAMTSASAVLDVLQEQTAGDITISNLVKEIPDDIEEQESMLQVYGTHNLHVYDRFRWHVISFVMSLGRNFSDGKGCPQSLFIASI